MYCREARGFCFLTRTGGVESKLWTLMCDWIPVRLVEVGQSLEDTCILSFMPYQLQITQRPASLCVMEFLKMGYDTTMSVVNISIFSMKFKRPKCLWQHSILVKQLKRTSSLISPSYPCQLNGNSTLLQPAQKSRPTSWVNFYPPYLPAVVHIQFCNAMKDFYRHFRWYHL